MARTAATTPRPGLDSSVGEGVAVVDPGVGAVGVGVDVGVAVAVCVGVAVAVGVGVGVGVVISPAGMEAMSCEPLTMYGSSCQSISAALLVW